MSNETILCHYLATIKGLCSSSKKWVHITLSKNDNNYSFTLKGKEVLLSTEKVVSNYDSKYTKTGENFVYYQLTNAQDSAKTEYIAKFSSKYNNADLATPIKQKTVQAKGDGNAMDVFLGRALNTVTDSGIAKVNDEAETEVDAHIRAEVEIAYADEQAAVATPEEEAQNTTEGENGEVADEVVEEVVEEAAEEVVEEVVDEVVEEAADEVVEEVVNAETDAAEQAEVVEEHDSELGHGDSMNENDIAETIEDEAIVTLKDSDEQDGDAAAEAPVEIPNEVESSEECEVRETSNRDQDASSSSDDE